MREETKGVIYMALDILESIKTNSSESDIKNFISIDSDIYSEVKEEIYQLLSGKNIEKISNNNKNRNEKEELIGLLPIVLIDKEKFPSNFDIIKLAEYSLSIKGLSKRKRSRNELIGIIVSELAEKEDKELDLFLKLWRKFMDESNNSLDKNKNTKINLTISSNLENTNNKETNFVDVWLEFFNNNKEK
ncbi:hypothetical protein [Ureibacillus thermosphaericus]|uniref:Uncharacterized protein n=1 Tax=Ureibacillus thermosphaericus TaxID=51173 RepID=A0A840PLL3_URETH|nr:hypothetical protein [Ureibacillus thermosphaericus]MBB5149305.1 hypothetical protein [Ureibacillus thermosphaericus]NKZ32117.1 hypothetical protein [Ureibacillus thermosphaericus]